MSSRAVWTLKAVVLGHGKPIFRGSGAAQKHVLHTSASTQVEDRSPNQNAMRPLWCNDGMIAAGELRVCKQLATIHQGLCV
jgi:hypothetical protein